MMGDLGTEFVNLPDGSEDLSLETVGSNLGANFSGQPGKYLSSLISKLISSKLPGGFNQSAIRAYLSSRWGLAPQRQTSVICCAVTAEPQTRLTSADAAKEYMDSIVLRYGRHAGVDLNSNSQSQSAAPAATSMVDSESLDIVKKEQRDFLMKQHNVLAKYLQIDSDVANDKIAETEAALKRSEDKLLRWSSEFGDDFFNGLKPSFDPRKARRYDSWWNWVREDLILLIQEVESGHYRIDSDDMNDRCLRIWNRWSPACADIIKAAISSPVASPTSRFTGAAHTLLHPEGVQLGGDPRFIYTLPTMAPKTTVSPEGSIQYSEIPRNFINWHEQIQSFDAEWTKVASFRRKYTLHPYP